MPTLRRMAVTSVVVAGLTLPTGCSAVARVTHPSSRISSSSHIDSAAELAFTAAHPTAAARLKESDVFGPVITAMPDAEVVEFPTVVVIGDLPAPDLATLASTAAQGITDVNGIFHRPPQSPVLLLAPKSQTEFDAIHGAGSTSQLGAFTVLKAKHEPYVVFDSTLKVTIETQGSTTTSTQTTQFESDLVRRKVVTHELVHDLTLSYAAREKRPLWLVEGVAEYIGQRAADITIRPSATTATLPTNADLTGNNAADAYQLATDFIRYLAKSFGRDAVDTFYLSAVDDLKPSMDAVARAAFGQDVATLTKRWVAQYRPSSSPRTS